MTDADKKQAIKEIYRDLRVRFFCKRDDERMGRIVDSVWGECKAISTRGKLIDSLEDRNYATKCCLGGLERSPNYQDTVLFISPWVIAFILKIIISILIDIWFAHEGTA